MSKEDPGLGEKPPEEICLKGIKPIAASGNNTKMFILPPHILQNLALIQTHAGTTLEIKKDSPKAAMLRKSSPASTQSALFVSQEHNYNCKDLQVVGINQKAKELENTSTSKNTHNSLQKPKRKLDKNDLSLSSEKVQEQVSVEGKEVLVRPHTVADSTRSSKKITVEKTEPSSKNPPQVSLAKSKKVKIQVNGLKRRSTTTNTVNERSAKSTPSNTIECVGKITEKSPEPVSTSENNANIRSSKRVRKKKEFTDYVTPKTLDKIFQPSSAKPEKEVKPVELNRSKKPRGRKKNSILVSKNMAERDIESQEHNDSTDLLEDSITTEKNLELKQSKKGVSTNAETIVSKNFVNKGRNCKEIEDFSETSDEDVLSLDVSVNQIIKNLDLENDANNRADEKISKVAENKAVTENSDNKMQETVINLNNKLELKNLATVLEGNTRNNNSEENESVEDQEIEKLLPLSSTVVEKESQEVESELESGPKSRERHKVEGFIRVNSKIQEESKIKLLNENLSDGKITRDLDSGISSANVSQKNSENTLETIIKINDKTDSEKVDNLFKEQINIDETKNQTVILEIVGKTSTTEEKFVEIQQKKLDKTEAGPLQNKSILRKNQKKLEKISRLRNERVSKKSGEKEDRNKDSLGETLGNVELSNISEKESGSFGSTLKDQLKPRTVGKLHRKSAPAFTKDTFSRETRTETKTQTSQREEVDLSVKKTPLGLLHRLPKKRMSLENYDNEIQKMDASEETNSKMKETISKETNKKIDVKTNENLTIKESPSSSSNSISKKRKISDNRIEIIHREEELTSETKMKTPDQGMESNTIIPQINYINSESSKSKIAKAFNASEDKKNISETVSDKSPKLIKLVSNNPTTSTNVKNLENTNSSDIGENNQSHEKSARENETFDNEEKEITKDYKKIILPFRKRGRYQTAESPANKNPKLELVESNSEVSTGVSERPINVRKKGRPAGKSIGISCIYQPETNNSPKVTKTDDPNERKEVLAMKIKGNKSQLGIKNITLSSARQSIDEEKADKVDLKPDDSSNKTVVIADMGTSSSMDVDSNEGKIRSRSTRGRSSTHGKDVMRSLEKNNAETKTIQPDLKPKRGRTRKSQIVPKKPTAEEESHEEGVEHPVAIPGISTSEINNVDTDEKKDLHEEGNESDKEILRGRVRGRGSGRSRGRKSVGRGKGDRKDAEDLNGPELKEEKVEPENESVIKEDEEEEIFEENNDDDEEEDEVDVEVRKSHRGFKGRGRRRRGRGRGRGPTRTAESRDTEYTPSTVCKPAGSPKKAESKSSASSTVVPTVTCAKCNKEMTKPAWSSHNLYSHNDMSWKVGDEPLDFENDMKLLKSVLGSAIKKRKGSLRCEKCSAVKRSAFGFISHLQFCGKTDEEKQALMQKCPICHNIMMPSSMEVHEKFHKQQEKQKLIAAQNTEPSELRGKRKAAEKAITKISEFTNLVKDEEVPLKKLKQNVRSLFEKPRLKKNINSVIKSLWNKEFAETSKVSCRQPGCTFTTNSIQTISDHYSKCNFIPRTTFVCKVCKWFAESEEQMVLHIQSEHSLDKDDQEYNSDGSTSYDSDEIMIEDDRKAFKKSLNKPNSNCSRTRLPRFKFIESESLPHSSIDRSYFPAVRWTLEFQLKNYGERLFKELTPNSFTLLDNEVAAKYLPKLEVTMPMRRIKDNKYDTLSADNVEWKTWKRFEGGFDEKIATFCVGGPVWALSWLPIPLQLYDRNLDQFVAVSTHPTMEIEYEAGRSYDGYNIIQIWNLGPLYNEKKGTTTPSLSYAIAHNNGTVWRFEFCPSGCYESELLSNFSPKNDTSMRQMGLLAAACSDGCVHIYSLPFPEQLEFVTSEKTEWPVYKTDPVMTLVVNRFMYNNKKQNWQCTSLSWTKEKGHEIIAAGYSNGYISLWNLTAKSKFLIHREGNTTILNAFKHFHAHNHVVTTVGLVPYGGKRFLATGGLDRYHKFWDLENTGSPQNSVLKGLITGGEWMNHWPCGVYCYDDGLGYGRTNSMLISVRQAAYQSLPLLNTRSATFGISVSDYGNSVCHGNLAGEILTIFPGQLMYYRDMERYIPKKRMLSSCIEVIDFEKKEDEASNSGERESDQTVTEDAANKSTANDKQEQFKEYGYMPETYEKCKNRFGLAFCDSVNPASKMTSKKLTKRKILSPEKLTTVPVGQYPFASVNQVSWNPNVWSYLNLAAGYQCGVIRLLNFKAMAASTEWKQFVPKTINAVFKTDNNKNDAKESV